MTRIKIRVTTSKRYVRYKEHPTINTINKYLVKLKLPFRLKKF